MYAAASLGRLVGIGLLTHPQAEQHLHAAAEHHIGVDRFTLAEANRTITDGLAFGARHTPVNPAPPAPARRR